MHSLSWTSFESPVGSKWRRISEPCGSIVHQLEAKGGVAHDTTNYTSGSGWSKSFFVKLSNYKNDNSLLNLMSHS